LQAKLLRVVQERELERLGGRERIPIDLRLVTATHRDLEAMVEHGDFRRDLYYRLRVVVVELTPLRERKTDVPLLAHHFLRLYGERFGKPGLRLSPAAMAALMAYPFPGNVRELENLIQAAVVLAPHEVIEEVELGLPAWAAAGGGASSAETLEEVEQRHIRQVLKAVEGNRMAAARILGIDRSTLYRKLRRFASDDATSNTSETY
jgi:DNA-binding NtrC family response regulator